MAELEEFAIWTVIWRTNARSFLIDFDDQMTAIKCSVYVEEHGGLDVTVSGPQLPDVKPEWIDAARERVYQAVIGKVQEENARLRVLSLEAVALAEQFAPSMKEAAGS